MGQIHAANEVPEMYAPVTTGVSCYVMRTSWVPHPSQVAMRTSASSQLTINQRSLPLTGLYLNRLTCQSVNLGLQRIIGRLRICCQSLWTCSLNMIWTWGDLGTGAWDQVITKLTAIPWKVQTNSSVYVWRGLKTPPGNVREQGNQTIIKSMGLGSSSGLKKWWQALVLYWFVQIKQHDCEGCS